MRAGHTIGDPVRRRTGGGRGPLLPLPEPGLSARRICYACGGSGRRGVFECPVCGGTGKTEGRPMKAYVATKGLPRGGEPPREAPVIRTRRRRRSGNDPQPPPGSGDTADGK